jgi:NAD(P)-dependent dehydrogenase (short-subunit alcohol dehydrogenase family)
VQDLEGRVAVVTGAASGIGLAMSRRFAAEGMKVVLADVERDTLESAVGDLKAAGHDATAVVTDVSDSESISSLAEKAVATYGKVHVLCNNAGVLGSSQDIWETTVADWQWTVGVNLLGVVHGIRSFVPIMLAQGEAAHVVNTASVSGLIPAGGIYGATKHAVVSISETLYNQLKLREAPIGVSVLCPGYVATRLIDSERNRPSALADSKRAADPAMREAARQLLAAGLNPEAAADAVITGIREDRLYLLTHSEYDDMIRTRVENILARRNPAPPKPLG